MKRIKTAVQKFGQQSAFYSALKDFFETLNLKINYLNDKPIDPGHLLKRTYKSGNPTHALMEDVYCLGMIDNASIKNEKDKSLEEIKKDEKDYDGVLIFGVTLKKRDNGNLPSRSQLAELTRSFNRNFIIPLSLLYSVILNSSPSPILNEPHTNRPGVKEKKPERFPYSGKSISINPIQAI